MARTIKKLLLVQDDEGGTPVLLRINDDMDLEHCNPDKEGNFPDVMEDDNWDEVPYYTPEDKSHLIEVITQLGGDPSIVMIGMHEVPTY